MGKFIFGLVYRVLGCLDVFSLADFLDFFGFLAEIWLLVVLWISGFLGFFGLDVRLFLWVCG